MLLRHLTYTKLSQLETVNLKNEPSLIKVKCSRFNNVTIKVLYNS